ncbi:MAG: hypothetical protein AUJ41_00715 [Candidatus Pacebacteria bacterium CG1_02_43_31]|nr:hypothetical protein [Candidatus Pacearchaeota archaeon]NCQ65469.1 hypothetical protein [Candidatus Paceibacterota bacterium]OIO45130.1 MAG: hypothetical protein AUJ41_00715 [Candidatus Pacebacteria bacterium CG1_02_43_31]PIQ81372.1 MAG: hypothetical protein COV78_00565 [Candidatus Pacebacteria bacterium CG11_big_fil_rev_8_21_14_0_20_34_55]PJC43306.1 MAG: hypothetical protein CO039_04785 [Candidatus Pacebacteria bacterium CG_4_9_14_0_2_um_filter_34_50]
MLVKTESLDMYRQFNGENPLGSFKIEEILQITGLNIFLDEMNSLFTESSPFFNQVSLLFTHYRRQLENLRIETLNNLAAKQLLKDFGVAGIGIDKDGHASPQITQKILEVHDGLVVNAETTSKELPSSIARFTTFITTIQREIIKLLIESQESHLSEIETKEKEEQNVTIHLSTHAHTNHHVVYESVRNSQTAQKQRKKEILEEKENIYSQLKTLFSCAKSIFNPIASGTREIITMTT